MQSKTHTPHAKFYGLTILALLVILFFRPVVAGHGWLPRGGGDLVSFIYPMYKFVANSLWHGQIPLWNPHQYAGTPLIADNQSGIFYPINLLLFLFNPNFGYYAIEMLVLFHYWLAGAGMFFFLIDNDKLTMDNEEKSGANNASLSIIPYPLFGAIAFMFSDLFIIHAGNLNLIAVAAWLPWVFWAFVRAVRGRGINWALMAGLLLGIATLAGHGQMTFIVASFLGVYAVYEAVVERRWRALPWLALVGVVAVGVAGVGIMPALSLNAHTIRGDFGYEQATNYSLPPRALIGLLAPHYFGRGSANFWGDWQRVEVGYMGILPLIFAIYAIFKQWHKRTAFFTLTAILFLLLAMGRYTPVYGWFFQVMPLPFQVPARFILLFNFSVAVLGTMGLRGWLHAKLPPFGKGGNFYALITIVILTCTMLATIYLPQAPHLAQMRQALLGFAGIFLATTLLLYLHARGKIGNRSFALLIVSLLFLDVYAQGRHVELEWTPPTTGYEHTIATQFLQDHTTIERIDEATGAWQPSAAQTANLYSMGGVFNPLQLANYAVYVGSVGYRGSPLYSLLGVKYIVAGKPEPPGDTHFIPLVFSDDPAVDIYENDNVLPRLQLLYNAGIVPDHNAAFDAIHAPDFDPSHTVILENGDPLTGIGQGDIQLLSYDLNEIIVDVETDAPAYLLLTDIYYPGWSVTVNGEVGEILLADYAFRAVRVNAGISHIKMTFSPPGWHLGVTTTTTTLLLLLGWWFYKAYKTKK